MTSGKVSVSWRNQWSLDIGAHTRNHTIHIFDITIESAQTSCGMSIPFFEYKGEREELNDWAEGKGKDGIKEYWTEKNQTSIDGLPTKILD